MLVETTLCCIFDTSLDPQHYSQVSDDTEAGFPQLSSGSQDLTQTF